MIVLHVRKDKYSRVTRNAYAGSGHASLALMSTKMHRAAGYQVAATVERLDSTPDEWATPTRWA